MTLIPIPARPLCLSDFLSPGRSLNDWFNSSGTNFDMQINAIGEKKAQVFQLKDTTTLASVKLVAGVVTTTGDAPLRVRVETVGATGFPTGVLYDANAYGTWSPASGAVTEVTFNAAFSVTAGDIIALVIEDASTVTAWDLFLLYTSTSVVTQPSSSKYEGGAWANAAAGRRFSFFLIDSNGDGIQIIGTRFTNADDPAYSFHSGTTPDEYGAKFVAPFAVRVCGVACMHDSEVDYILRLYDSLGNTLLSITVDKDIRDQTSGGVLYVYFASKVTLVPKATYRVSLIPQATGTATRMSYIDFGSAQHAKALVDGFTFHTCSRTDAGAWTDTATGQVPAIDILIDAIDFPAGGETSHIF